MFIKGITLFNYGFYYNENDFDFNTNNSTNNIILIGGANGSGKSTILEAIKVALYGSLYMGYKTNSEEYNNFIEDMINYNVNALDHEMYINLDFELNKGGNKRNYKLKRKWEIASLEESLIIRDDKNKKLNEEETNNLMNYIRKIYPPSLFDFFLFDGEKISGKLYSKNFQATLRDIILNFFNLYILKTLKKDINNALINKTSNSTIDEKESQYIEIKNEFNEITSKIDKHENRLKEIEDEKDNLNKEYQTKKQEFKLNGGLLAKEREKINEKISKLEQKKVKLKNELDELIDSYLPFLPSKEHFSEIIRQINKEREYNNYINLSKKLNETQVAEKITNELNGKIDLDTENESKTAKTINIFLEVINKTIKPDFDLDNFEVLHNLSPSEEEKLKHMAYDIKNINTKDLINKINEISKINKRIYEKKNLLEENKQNSDLQDLLEKIENINNNLREIKIEENNIEKELINLYKERDEIEKKKNNIYKELLRATKEKSVPVVCNKLENVINKYMDIRTKKKLQELEVEFIGVINQLFSENNYITNIKIDPDSFEIKLFNDKKELKKLSSGEQQLVILALLWSLINLSKNKLPIVFDTLLGRIDSKHRINIIEKLINHTNEQIIVLATDSEINSQFYDEIRPFLAREYLLSKENKLDHKASIYEEKYLNVGV